jgi:hypothetical protein
MLEMNLDKPAKGKKSTLDRINRRRLKQKKAAKRAREKRDHTDDLS